MKSLNEEIFKSTEVYNIVDRPRSKINSPSSKGNHAPTQKFERPNGKNTKSNKFLKSVQNVCPLSHLKAL